jgi:hypothetical protein
MTQQQVQTPTIPTIPTIPTTPTKVIQVQQPTAPIEPLFAFDEDSYNESNTGDQITESFVDGISGGSTANCGVF